MSFLQRLRTTLRSENTLPQIWAAALAASESGSFRTLAAYVFGDNDRQERIGMTAPVINAEDRMAFIMPGRYNLENLPRP